MRLCHVTDASDPSYGGLYTSTRGLVRALSRAKPVTSVSLAWDARDSNSEVQQFGPATYPFSRTSLFSRLRAVLLPSGERDADWVSADLCHAHGMWAESALVSLAWRLRTGKPLIVAPHGMLDEWALRNRRVRKMLALISYEGMRLRKSACIHALCEAELVSVERLGLGVPVFVIPNGVDLPPAEELVRERAVVREPNVRKTLLYLGRIDPKKGIELVIHALAMLVARDRRFRDEWAFQVCGQGDASYVAQLGRLAAELGLSEIVAFTGPIQGERKRQMLASSSAFVLTSFSEGLPMAVLEAWAYGLPSLISPQCNLSRAAHAGAALIAETSTHEVVAKLAELLGLDDRERSQMGRQARAYVERVHSWDTVCARMIDVYRWVLGDGPRPDPV
jgi:glycosyltransferase involved in cell wall biosynthesis